MKFIHPLFSCQVDDFIKMVRVQKVLLEYIIYSGMDDVKGFVRISNLCYHKIVAVRVTKDNWGTFHDIKAEYSSSDRDFLTDRFVFSISCIPMDECYFAIRLQTESGEEFWDSNHGENYKFILNHRFNHSQLSNC